MYYKGMTFFVDEVNIWHGPSGIFVYFNGVEFGFVPETLISSFSEYIEGDGTPYLMIRLIESDAIKDEEEIF